jgi:DNA modification methylase
MILIHEGDAIEKMRELKSCSIDMILCDLPYGTTYASWDKTLPVQELKKEWLRVAKPSGYRFNGQSTVHVFLSYCVD